MDHSVLSALLLAWVLFGSAQVAATKRPAWRKKIQGIMLALAIAAAAFAGLHVFHPLRPSDADLQTSPRSLFATDLVLSTDAKIAASEGLMRTTGPFPWRDLPYVREARRAAFTVTIPATPGLARVQLGFSVQAADLKLAGIELRLNGLRVQEYPAPEAAASMDCSAELRLKAGENTLEFVAIPQTSDWLGYLDLYPDVHRSVLARNVPLEEGARHHYEAAGRNEGRTLPVIQPPADDGRSTWLIFRRLRLEGFPAP